MINLDRFDEYLRDGRLIRGEWTGEDSEGRATACWLAALFDEVAENKSATSCPAGEIPAWLAQLIPWMDDSGTKARWAEFALRLGKTLRVPRTAEQWHRAEYAVRAITVREAMRHTDDAKTLEACERVIALCESVVGGTARDDQAFAEAADAAEAAAWAAEARAAEAAARAADAEARAAAWAAEAEAWAAARAAEAAAWAAAWAAEAEAWAAEAAAWAAWAEAWAAEAWAEAWAEEAADRIINGVLRVLEAHGEVTP